MGGKRPGSITSTTNKLCYRTFVPPTLADRLRALLAASGPEQALSALVQGRACGLLATSSDLELGLLQSCFQLDDYEHLVKVIYKKMPNSVHTGWLCRPVVCCLDPSTRFWPLKSRKATWWCWWGLFLSSLLRLWSIDGSTEKGVS